ncbi:MAG: hypothetical protein NT047_04535, partial [Deltaproteobacteria bacterium]|nr:hypothetical protein [Deltaproteobacteria bacterium]
MKKILSILMGFLIVILTAGCGQVVYRVKPDSPPKMGIQEAKEAIELSLSLAQIPPNKDSLKLQGDELVMSTFMLVPNFHMKADYNDISQEVGKYGKSFAVQVYFKGLSSRVMQTLYWKSEGDARSFVDAAYALRPATLRKYPVKKEMAISPTPSSQKDVPREAPEPTKITQQRKSTAPDSDKGKPASPLPSESASTQSPPIVLVEKTPPKITITSPDVTGSLKVAAKESRITVAGVVESKIGISEITVNGLLAKLQDKGNFSADVPLKTGPNDIVITAFDSQRNKTSQQLIVHREDIKPDLAKKEAPTAVADKKPVQAPTIQEEEKTPPKILIVSPNVIHNRPVISEGSSMTVAGTVESKIGLVDVLINGQPVNVDEKGNFSENIFLKIGKNDITIMAIDIRKNQVIKQFVVNRERVLFAKVSQTDASVPKIVIISPDVTRAVSVVAKKPNITIIGIAESKIGIADVLINGQHADIDEKGNFSID